MNDEENGQLVDATVKVDVRYFVYGSLRTPELMLEAVERTEISAPNAIKGVEIENVQLKDSDEVSDHYK